MMTIQGQDLARENKAVEFAQAETRFNQSQSGYKRRLKLFRGNAISERQFIETRSVYITDSIRYYNLKQSYKAGGLKIISPIVGYIHELKVSQGEFVRAGTLIATVSSDRRLLLRADVPQQYFHRIRDIVSTNFRTSYHKEVWDVRDLDGKLLAIGSSVAENKQYLPVYFEALNNGQLLEGAYAEFFLKTSPIEDCIVVPVEAVLEERGMYYVYVQATGEIFQKREIIPGDLDGFGTLVQGGLSAGDRVVTRGSMLLKTASMSTALPGDSHQH
jgi:RND family efflux transporter MFP subunit